MGTTGLIYAAIVAAWAAYLVPMLLRRGDEVSPGRPRETHAPSTVRVLSRQIDEQDRARYVVIPKGKDALSPRVPPVRGAVANPPVRRGVANRAPQLAAMRRRRVLSILTLSLLSVTVLAGFAMLPWWSLSIPGGLMLLFVGMTRFQLRKQASLRAAQRKARVVVSDGRRATSLETEPTVEVGLPTVEPMAEPAALVEPPAEGLWDPVPVTLPTYVHKEKAPDRTVRTISLSGPEVSSSARAADPEPDFVPAPPVAPTSARVVEEPAETEIRRAVGD